MRDIESIRVVTTIALLFLSLFGNIHHGASEDLCLSVASGETYPNGVKREEFETGECSGTRYELSKNNVLCTAVRISILIVAIAVDLPTVGPLYYSREL
jgi:hypothetical protein